MKPQSLEKFIKARSSLYGIRPNNFDKTEMIIGAKSLIKIFKNEKLDAAKRCIQSLIIVKKKNRDWACCEMMKSYTITIRGFHRRFELPMTAFGV